MSKLKILTNDDLSTISEFFGETLEEEVSKKVSTKDLEDIDLGFVVNYENAELNVSVDLDVSFDELSHFDQELFNQAIDEAYLKLDSFIETNFME